MHTILYVNVSIHSNDRYVYTYIYIFIYKERERERDTSYATTRRTIFTCIHIIIQFWLFPHLPHYKQMELHDRIMIVYKVFAIGVAHSLMQNL